MTEPPLMTLVVLGVDLLVTNRISPLLVNMEVSIGDDSYFKTGRLLTYDAWINQVGVVHLKSQGRCGKEKRY